MVERMAIRMEGPTWTRLLADIAYSVRRFYVDQFFFGSVTALTPASRVLDLGGVRNARRGEFRAEEAGFDVKFANMAASAKPDYLCDATGVPATDGAFDAAILSEVIEHAERPEAVFAEVTRLLRPGGRMLATAPFAFYYHPNPVDVARYTHDYYRATVPRHGLRIGRLVAQGSLPTTAAGMLKDWIHELHPQGRPYSRTKRRLLHRLTRAAIRGAFRHEVPGVCRPGVVFDGYADD